MNREKLDHSSFKPLYMQMEDIIKDKLSSNEWPPGSLIPSENELSKQYGISRMTVRNVITKFVNDESLFRIPGKGTFVSEPKIQAKPLSYAGIREQLEQMGYEVSTILLDISKKRGSEKMCKRFGLPEHSMFYLIKRLRFLKNEPFSIHTSYIPVKLCSHLEKYDLVNTQLCEILNVNYNLNRAKVYETLESVPANSENAKLLNIQEGSPVLLLHDTVYDTNNNPYEFTTVLFRGEKLKLELEF